MCETVPPSATLRQMEFFGISPKHSQYRKQANDNLQFRSFRRETLFDEDDWSDSIREENATEWDE